MSRGKFTLYIMLGFVGAGSLLGRPAGGTPIDPAPAPVTAAIPSDPPLVSYPPITPWTAWSFRSISEIRHLNTATGMPRLPTPNPWFPLDLYQGSMTRQDFELKLDKLFDPFSGLTPYLDINDSRVIIYPSPNNRTSPQFTLQFAPPGQPAPAPRWFRTPEEVRAVSHPLDKPLNGLRVAIDPGHIGGAWGQMEERSTSYGGGQRVQEGDLNLITARLLKQQLINLGATVYVIRDSTDPVTPYRPDDFLPEARQLLQARASRSTNLRALPPDGSSKKLKQLSEFLFYRCSEIRERGNSIRNNFVPDITVTLYIDATPSSGRGRLTSANANIFFVGGSYTRSEMSDPEMRRRCIYKMLEGGSAIEAEVAAAIASVFTQKTGLPPVKYGDSATTRQVLPGNLYVVARNLAANRDYDGPVVCTEPYFMNNRVVCQRLLAGDYEGQKTFDGKKYTSIFREYADCVAQGLVKAYSGSTVIAGVTTGPASPQNQAK